MQFFDTMAAGIPNEEKPKCLYYYLEGVRHLKVKQAFEGSLRITVECPTLEILDELWEDYSSCLLYTSPSPRDQRGSRMPSSA